MSLTQAVKVEARRLGFQLVGVTTPDSPPHLAVYQSWLAADRQGEMAYLATPRARQRRADPRRILPECRSILVLGVRYPNPDIGVESSTTAAGYAGRVASYAWGDDYHIVLPARLEELVRFIEVHVGRPIPSRWYTDSGPLLERDLAQRAGLGWIGKNTCLINPQHGSYYLLAEILLGIELEADLPYLADRCGSCTRCLEACPTGCILPDRTLDARRCISYLTIELKGLVPPDLRPMMGDWVFGCDICQEVCPWNERFASRDWDPVAGDEVAFSPRSQVPRPELVEELSLTPEMFSRKFNDSPVKRARRRGYLRNVAISLGNRAAGTGDEVVISALARSLCSEPEALVRRHVAWALGQVGGEAARLALTEAERSEVDDGVLDEIRAGLEALEYGGKSS
jgi:epoxyqueuosine reductase